MDKATGATLRDRVKAAICDSDGTLGVVCGKCETACGDIADAVLGSHPQGWHPHSEMEIVMRDRDNAERKLAAIQQLCAGPHDNGRKKELASAIRRILDGESV